MEEFQLNEKYGPNLRHVQKPSPSIAHHNCRPAFLIMLLATIVANKRGDTVHILASVILYPFSVGGQPVICEDFNFFVYLTKVHKITSRYNIIFQNFFTALTKFFMDMNLFVLYCCFQCLLLLPRQHNIYQQKTNQDNIIM